MPLESVPPFVIITGAIAAMGVVIQGVNYITFGKPKAIGQDGWDRLVGARDRRLAAEAKARPLARPALRGSAV